MNLNFNDKTIDYAESFNVVIGTGSFFQSLGSFNNLLYAINWDFLPEQAYNVHFTYLGGPNNLTGDELANLFIDFGASNNTYNAGSSVNAVKSNFLGVLKPYILGGSSFLLAEDNTNPPIYLSSRPRNNVFQVTLYDNTGGLFNPTTGALAEYKLMLKFIPAKSIN